jgi:ABC-type transporter MlaC component
MAIKHFRDCLFTKTVAASSSTINSSPSKPDSRQHSQSVEAGKQKFDQLLSYIYVSRKGITWQELRELIPNLTDEDIELFQSIFGFLLVSYMPDNNISAS